MRRDIKCNTPRCGCVKKVQALGYPTWRRFVLTDVSAKVMWFDNPKCASTTIKSNLDLEWSHILPKNHREYFKFVFVRNPYDRMVSNWKMFTTTPFALRKIKSYQNHLVEDIERISFKEFVNLTDHIDNHHWDEQYYFIRSKPDFIGRFENFQEDFNELCDKLGTQHQQLPVTNKTKHKHYTEYYDDETRQIVAEKYAKDIAMFGYDFGE